MALRREQQLPGAAAPGSLAEGQRRRGAAVKAERGPHALQQTGRRLALAPRPPGGECTLDGRFGGVFEPPAVQQALLNLGIGRVTVDGRIHGRAPGDGRRFGGW